MSAFYITNSNLMSADILSMTFLHQRNFWQTGHQDQLRSLDAAKRVFKHQHHQSLPGSIKEISMTISASPKARLDKAMFDIGSMNPKYVGFPNASYVEITFDIPGVDPGTIKLGETFFDIRKTYIEALKHRGFDVRKDNQGRYPVSIIVQDSLPDNYTDGTVLGLDDDGNLLQWDEDDLSIYNCGETPEKYGIDSLDEDEMERINLDRLFIMTKNHEARFAQKNAQSAKQD